MEEKLFAILRFGLEIEAPTESDRDVFGKLTADQWNELISLADKHGVGAIAFDGYQKLFKDTNQPLDIDTLMDWLGQTSYLEQRNEQQITVLKDLCGRLIKDDCTVMLMKGQANALYYPNPKHRATGDIDIYMLAHVSEFLVSGSSDNNEEHRNVKQETPYSRANRLASEYGAKVDTGWYKHSQIHYKDEMFENHQYFVHTRDGKRGKELNEAIKASLNAYDNVNENANYFKHYPESEILLAPVEFNAKFLTYHALAHFISEGLHLKQVLDWVMFLKKEQNNIDWKDIYAFCDKFHLRRFLDVMNDIAVHNFGIRIDNPEVTTTSPYTEKVLHSILYDEDYVFGSGEGSWHNRLHLITNMWKYHWKYSDIYQTSIFKQLYYYASGYLFHTE